MRYAIYIMRCAIAVCVWLAAAFPASAQVDLAGEWGTLNFAGLGISSEDQPHRNGGATLGDYTGLPINEAARQKARSWDAAVLSQPERQAQPHPAQYSTRGGAGPNLRIAKIIEPRTVRLLGYEVQGFYGGADRVIWMDGRPHPSEYAEHTWGGFSTGVWENGYLKVTTTHMKMGVIQRNGVPSSPKGTMVEYWMRRGTLLTVFTWIDDPIYLEEPMVRTTDWILDPTMHVGPAQVFETVDELGDKPRGWVPSWPLGTENHELATQYHLPFEATQGGTKTLYPEYMREIERWRREHPRASQ